MADWCHRRQLQPEQSAAIWTWGGDRSDDALRGRTSPTNRLRRRQTLPFRDGGVSPRQTRTLGPDSPNLPLVPS